MKIGYTISHTNTFYTRCTNTLGEYLIREGTRELLLAELEAENKNGNVF